MSFSNSSHHFSISKEQLLYDLYLAYKAARKHNKGKKYLISFEFNLEENLVQLRDELLSGNYKPLPSSCFIIHEPKMREVFAANFRDRIVHHLLYNYCHVLFERTFIYDSYSCIKGRGTHFGISRMLHHIRSMSKGFSSPCYVLKIDIKGYFMSIDRRVLSKICNDTLDKMMKHKSDSSGLTWYDKLDYPFLKYLLDITIWNDPVKDCIKIGDEDDWEGLPVEKSLFHSGHCCGLPIGNLSSQLFSNIYMNEFDQFVKRELGCKHYGRYVDDAYIVDNDKDKLIKLIPPISQFLEENLNLRLQFCKTKIYNVRYGVEFLGAYILPHRTYVSNSTKKRINSKIMNMPNRDDQYLRSSVNSILGIFSHYDSYCYRKVMVYKAKLTNYGYFSRDTLRFTPFGI